MREMSLREFRQVMGVIDDILAAHGEVILTRHGRPMAKVIALPERVAHLEPPVPLAVTSGRGRRAASSRTRGYRSLAESASESSTRASDLGSSPAKKSGPG